MQFGTTHGSRHPCGYFAQWDSGASATTWQPSGGLLWAGLALEPFLRGRRPVQPPCRRTLERDYEAALAAHQTLENEHQRGLTREPERLTLEVQAAVHRLAEDIPALWGAPSTTARDRQTIARTMLERVVIPSAGRHRAGGDCVPLGWRRGHPACGDPSGASVRATGEL